MSAGINLKGYAYRSGSALILAIISILVMSALAAVAIVSSLNTKEIAKLGAENYALSLKARGQLQGLKSAALANLQSYISTQTAFATISSDANSATRNILVPSGFNSVGETFKIDCYSQGSTNPDAFCTTDPAIVPKFFRIKYSVVSPDGAIATYSENFQIQLSSSGGLEIVNFSTPGNPSTGYNPFSTAFGDLNGDGKVDMVVGNYSNGSFYVYLGNGDGTFTFSQSYPAGTPHGILLVDINGDGKLDMVSADGDKLSSRLGNGDGTFQARKTRASGSNSQWPSVGDMDGDGIPDAVVCDRVDGTYSIYKGNGDGTFQARKHMASGGQGCDRTKLVDINGDGKLDLISNTQTYDDTYGNEYGYTTAIAISLGNGDGTFQAPVVTDTQLAVDGSTLVIGDFDGDGKIDIATTGISNAKDKAQAIILKGDGTGNLTPATTVDLGNHTDALLAVDLNGNGKLDLVTADITDYTISIVMGNGDGTFQPRIVKAAGGDTDTGTPGNDIQTADFNGDGLPDLAVSQATFQDIQSDKVLIFLQTAPGSDGGAGGGSGGGSGGGATAGSWKSSVMYSGQSRVSIDDALSYVLNPQ